MVIEWYKVESEHAAVDKTIRDLQVRQHTGATIIAVIEPDGTQRINPEPDQIIQQGATLVVIGRREHMQALKQLIGGEER